MNDPVKNEQYLIGSDYNNVKNILGNLIINHKKELLCKLFL